LITAVALALLSSSQAPSQDLALSLQRERLERLRAGYLESAESERVAVLSVFDGIRSAANPEGATLQLSSLELALSALKPERPATPEQALASALALSVSPGAFEAREDGMGEATTVRISRTEDVAIEGDQVLSLYWISPSGEEQRARREVMPLAVLRAGSLEMFIRPPSSAPGPWQLVCEVGVEDRVARGLPVRVDCVSELASRRSALPAHSVSKSVILSPQMALTGLCERGLRHPVLGAGELLTLAEGGSLGRLSPVLHESHLELHISPLRAAEGTVVIAGGSSFSPLELAAGASASAWLSFAEREGLRLVFLKLPLSPRRDGLSLPERVIQLRDEQPEDSFHLVAFGDVAGFVPSMRARHPALPLDSVTLVSNSLKRAKRDPRLDLRTLLVECSGDSPEPAWSEDDGFHRVLIREPFLLSSALVPELISAWREAR